MKTLSILLILLLCNPAYSQGVLVPTFDDLPETYDDSELRKRVEAIEEALNKLGDTIPPPPGEEPLPPVDGEPEEPSEPTDPIIPDPPPVDPLPTDSSILPITLPNGELWTGLTNPPPTAFRSDHPRIWVTPETLPALREKLEHPRYAKDVESVRESANGSDKAFCYLVWGNEVKGRQAIESLWDSSFTKWNTMEAATKVLQRSLMHDWLYNLMTPEERVRSAELIVAENTLHNSVDYYWTTHWIQESAWSVIAMLALNEEGAEYRQKMLDPTQKGFKVYRGALDILTSTSLQHGGGWNLGNGSTAISSYEPAFAMYGGPMVLKAWETATGQRVFQKTTYFETMPFELLTRRRVFSNLQRHGQVVGEMLTGMDISPEARGLASWMLSKDGWPEGSIARVPRMIFGDRRVEPLSPEEIGVPLAGVRDGGNYIYTGTGWGKDDTYMLFFARHWDRHRWEQQSSGVTIFKDGNLRVLPIGTEHKGVQHLMPATGFRVYPEGAIDKSQGQTYSGGFAGPRDRASQPGDVVDPSRPWHRPETLTRYEEEGGVVTATARFEKQLHVEVPVAQRSVVMDPHAGTILINDYAELANEAVADIAFCLSEEPTITGNVIETSAVRITMQSAFESIEWDTDAREKDSRGLRLIKGTVVITPTVDGNVVNAQCLVEAK